MILDRVHEEFVVPSSGESRIGTAFAGVVPACSSIPVFQVVR
jgi:hypothetical protein